MADLYVTKPNLAQRIHLLTDAGDGLEKLAGIFAGHVKNIGDAFVFELNFQSFAVVALALAGLAGDINIRQEVHLDLDDTVALTGLAAPAFDVEREPPGLIAARLGLGQARKPIADRGEGPGVGRGV